MPKHSPRTDPNPIAADIRSIRAEFGLTQGQLAMEIGVTWITVSRWENSHFIPSRMATAALRRWLEEKKNAK
jgi:DNA-binding transcriptional regulator YiaG